MAELIATHHFSWSLAQSVELGMAISTEQWMLYLALHVANISPITTDLKEENFHFSLEGLPSPSLKIQLLFIDSVPGRRWDLHHLYTPNYIPRVDYGNGNQSEYLLNEWGMGK